MNKVILIGRLGKDPELHAIQGGSAYCRFSVATSQRYKDKDGEWQENTQWHNILMWRKLAENAHKILKKGDLVSLDGKIEYRKWTDDHGQTKYMTEITAYSFDKLIWKKDDSIPDPVDPYTSYDPDETNKSGDAMPNDDLPF